jgi:Transposase DDE domain
VKKNGGHAAQALGRSRGGLSTKIHAGCRDERTGVAIVLTAGHCHESPVFETVLAQVPPVPSLTHAIMDKGYDSTSIREQLIVHDIVPVIPPKSNRIATIDYDKNRHLSKQGESS